MRRALVMLPGLMAVTAIAVFILGGSARASETDRAPAGPAQEALGATFAPSRTLYLPVFGSVGEIPTGPTTSRYVDSLIPSRLNGWGCAAGQAATSGTIVLAFGQPYTVTLGGGVQVPGVYYFAAELATLGQVEIAARNFMTGYANCVPAGIPITVALGTNNYRGATGSNHGREWGLMVNRVAASVAAAPYSGLINVVGAIDAEPGFYGPIPTRAWVDGYASVANRPLLNFGSCDGCPTSGAPALSTITGGGWTIGDIWYVSGGNPIATALPEIYLTSGTNARQWKTVALSVKTWTGKDMRFAGVMTQWQACNERGNQAECEAIHIDNTPQEGWDQMNTALASNALVAQPLGPPTDISWEAWDTSFRASAVPKTTFTRPSGRALGWGYLLAEATPPLPASQFIGNNAWQRRVGAIRTIVYAGTRRDEGGAKVAALAVFRRDDSRDVWQPFAGGEQFKIYRPAGARGTLRIVSARGAVLELRDAANVRFRFDTYSLRFVR